MTLAVKHNFVSAKADGTDPTLLKPSYWNDTHSIQCATNVILGRATAGTGTVEELPTSAAVIALLASADLATFLAAIGAPTTGDGKPTLKTTPDTGWLMLDDGTFGNVGSGSSGTLNGSTTVANATANLALFTLLYNGLSDANAQIFTSAGSGTTRGAQGSAATAWAALCRMSLPKQLGRALVGAGSGSGLTARTLGSSFGEESHALSTAELASHYHSAAINDPQHSHGAGGTAAIDYVGYYGTNGAPPYGYAIGGNYHGTLPLTITVNNASTGVRVWDGVTNDRTYTAGSGTAHNNTQASTAWNVMVKL